MRSGTSGADEAVVGQALALLVGDLDVRRGEEEHLVGHPLHAAGEGVRGTGAEVDHAALQVAVGGLHVDDHRLVAHEPVGDLHGVGEAAGDTMCTRALAADDSGVEI